MHQTVLTILAVLGVMASMGTVAAMPEACMKHHIAPPDGAQVGRFLKRPQLSTPRGLRPPAFACVVVTVDEEGKVAEAEIVETNSPELAESVRTQVLTWRALPTTKDGRAIIFRTLVAMELSD